MNFKKAYKDFFTPRFTTGEMERSCTRNHAEHEIIKMFYADNRPTLPTWAKGTVTTKLGNKRKVIWNQFGECTFYGNRIEYFDLVHPEAGYIFSAKAVFFSMIALFIITLITAIWN